MEAMEKKDILAVVAVIALIGIGTYAYLSGSNESNTAPKGGDQQAAALVPFEKIIEGSKSSVEKRVNYLISTPEGLKKVWSMIDATSTPPQIDFTKNAIVAVFSGKGGYADIAVARIEDADERTVSISVTELDKSCAKTVKMETMPYEIVTVPATTLPLTHKDIVTTTGCSN